MRLFAVALALAAVLVARVRAETGVSEKEIVIGSCSDHSTDAQKARTEMRLDGVKAYFDHVNDQGGVHGRKLKLLEEDDGYDPAQAIGCFNKLVDQGVFAAGFFIGGPVAAKYAPLAESKKVPVVGFVAGSQFLYKPVKKYVFAVRGSYEDMLEGTLAPLCERGKKKIGVIYQQDAFGVGGLEAAQQVAGRHGCSVVGSAAVPHGSAEVAEALEMVRQSGAEVVVMALVSEPAANVLTGSRQMGWKPVFLSISNNPQMFKLAGPAMDGVVLPEVVPAAARTDIKAVAQYRALLKKYFPDAKPTSVGLEGFAEAMVMVEGLKKAGEGLTRDGFIAALEGMQDLDLGLGSDFHVDFSAASHKAFHAIYPTVVKDGKPVLVKDWDAVVAAR